MERNEVSNFKRFIFSKSFILTARTIVALIFIYSGSIKILNIHEFAQVIGNYHILPHSLLIPFASLIVSSEIVLGLLFLIGVFEKECGILLILLNIVFIFAMVSTLVRGIDTSCGCFSSEGEVLGIKDILRDFAFILFIVYVIVGGKYEKSDC